MSLDRRFAGAMGHLLGPDFPSDIALAVSGGGDSMAMLTLAHNWAHAWGVRLWVVTVDHGLRPESAAEAAMVAEECAALGWPHAVLRWHWDGTGNTMDAGRRARLGLIDRWRGSIGHVLMAHTRDDVAETFLMRLARGSGIDGLSAMAACHHVFPSEAVPGEIAGDLPPAPAERSPGFLVVRPCLEMGREELRHYLRTLKGRWVEDPSNEDPAYGRARMRRLMALLETEGLGRDRLAETAVRLGSDREALRLRAAELWGRVGRAHETAAGDRSGVLILDPDWHRQSDPATARRLLGGLLHYLSGADHGPRAEALDGFHDRVASGGGGTLHGCEAAFRQGRLLLFREQAAVAGQSETIGPETLWDGRWRPAHRAFDGCTLRALGENGWRETAPGRAAAELPHRAALSLPSIWQDGTLLACDGLNVGPGGSLRSRFDEMWPGGVREFLLSH
ncbi:tRNA lysidine(34) synthetase TilS [Thetidibacter halocola]|uniref:tRNA(Ile)-lysidine synthase n=1 Tax=Thetidibacter halocola TaxID=2827239 RepID=A0A8J7WDA4_9RHOB|nr:tRNA lysidine(34) synthetase TilS [Thetidibacter halocola]MBS0125482.1 tRNA lysidine(34) synthetase TilS [Thetidibacter halocola]